MAFPDTITLTVNAVAKVLTRINSGKDYASEYRLRGTTDEYRLMIRHSTFVEKSTGVSRNRHNVEVTHRVFAIAPAIVDTVRKSYIVLEEPVSDVVTDVQKFDEAFVAFASAANITKLLNYES